MSLDREGAEASLIEAVTSGVLLPAYSDALARLSAHVTQAVVSVRVRRTAPVPAPGYPDDQALISTGSAVAAGPRHQFLTAAHVVERAVAVSLVGPYGGEIEAQVVGLDPVTDIALLSAPAAVGACANRLEAAGFDSQVGQWVMAVGGPAGTNGIVTTGVLTATGRATRGAGGRLIEDVLQSDALLTPGASGGALVDARGRLLGINISAATEARGASFATPVTTALWVADTLRRRGFVPRPDVGLELGAVQVGQPGRPESTSPVACVRVEAIAPSGASQRAGIEPGDLIAAVAGAPVGRPAAFRRILSERSGSRSVEIDVIRRGRRVTVTVALPDAIDSRRSSDLTGSDC